MIYPISLAISQIGLLNDEITFVIMLVTAYHNFRPDKMKIRVICV